MVILLNKGTNTGRVPLHFVIGLLNMSQELHYLTFPKTHLKFCLMLLFCSWKKLLAPSDYQCLPIHTFWHGNSYCFSMSVPLSLSNSSVSFSSSKICWGILAQRIALHAWISVLKALLQNKNPLLHIVVMIHGLKIPEAPKENHCGLLCLSFVDNWSYSNTSAKMLMT